jgi:hypothetical protein
MGLKSSDSFPLNALPFQIHIYSTFELHKKTRSIVTFWKGKHSMPDIRTDFRMLWSDEQFSHSILGRTTLPMATHLLPNRPISYLPFLGVINRRVGCEFTRFVERYGQSLRCDNAISQLKSWLLSWVWWKTTSPGQGAREFRHNWDSQVIHPDLIEFTPAVLSEGQSFVPISRVLQNRRFVVQFELRDWLGPIMNRSKLRRLGSKRILRCGNRGNTTGEVEYRCSRRNVIRASHDFNWHLWSLLAFAHPIQMWDGPWRGRDINRIAIPSRSTFEMWGCIIIGILKWLIVQGLPREDL